MECELVGEARGEAIIREGLRRNRSSVQLQVGLAMVLVNTARLGEGRGLLDEALSLFPDSPLPLLGKASLAIVEGRFDSAVDYCQNAEHKIDFVRDPESAERLAAILVDIPAQEQWLERVLQTILRERVESGWPNLIYGVLLESRGDPAATHHLQDAWDLWGGPRMTFERQVEMLRRRFSPSAGDSPAALA